MFPTRNAHHAILPLAALSMIASCWALSACAGTSLAGSPMFPADNAWNQDMAGAPLHPNSSAFVASITSGSHGFLHANFGSSPDYGIPYIIVPESQPRVPIVFVDYGDESDPIPTRSR